MTKLYYIKERNNPQFDKAYYVCCGRLTKKEATLKEGSIYGHNTMLPFKTEQEYNDKIAELQTSGHHVLPYVDFKKLDK